MKLWFFSAIRNKATLFDFISFEHNMLHYIRYTRIPVWNVYCWKPYLAHVYSTPYEEWKRWIWLQGDQLNMAVFFWRKRDLSSLYVHSSRHWTSNFWKAPNNAAMFKWSPCNTSISGLNLHIFFINQIFNLCFMFNSKIPITKGSRKKSSFFSGPTTI